MQTSALFSALSAYAATRNWQYVYPVWSRRAEGISIGINLHPNHVCNWHCIYCQVPALQRGHSPHIAIVTLQNELEVCLQWLNDYTSTHKLGVMQNRVQDIAFAGDGEPTTSPQFAETIQLVGNLLNQYSVENRPKRIRLITNGSQCHYAHVQHALQYLHMIGGEVWFKLDAGNDAEMQAINDCHTPFALHLQRLKACAAFCQTWIQTAVISRRSNHKTLVSPSLPEYMQTLNPLKDQIAGILLYGIARPSQQMHAECLESTSEEVLQDYASELRAHGFNVRAYN
jgi:wyosine [tRNA(Phe)-imidazoG37] synthetase (radical SAM superfamily)